MNQDDACAPKRKRGRPAIGQGHPVYVRFRPHELDELDAWRRDQNLTITRACAIRSLVDYALTLYREARQEEGRRVGAR